MEFGMRSSANANPQGGVDWYTPSSGYTYNTSSGAGFSGGAGGLGGGHSANFEDEPPLLEELGIDVAGILKKTRSVLLHRLNNKVLDDLDMGGALIFVFVLGGLHLLTGKLHFGIILGWSVVHSAALWFVLNQLAGGDSSEGKGLDLYSVCCVVGYCLVPLVVFSVLSLLIPRGLVTLALALLCTLWSSHTAAKVFVRRSPGLEEQQGLIMYPCLLMYSAFMMLCVY